MTAHTIPPRRWPYLLLAYGCAGAGAAGIVLPGLPTTPFLLLALWAAGRGSPALAERLRRHPRVGPALLAWQREGAVPPRAKRLAVAMLALSWLLLAALADGPLLPAVLAGLFVLVAAYIVSRPSPRAGQESHHER